MSTTAQTTELPIATALQVETSSTNATEVSDICQLGDKECLARLVQAFSDCD